MKDYLLHLVGYDTVTHFYLVYDPIIDLLFFRSVIEGDRLFLHNSSVETVIDVCA